MDARTAEIRFKEADSLYRDGRYDEALDRLIELDETFPNTPNILFPLARCLRHTGRIDEALGICDDLITRYGDLRALDLREFIRKSHNPATEPTPHPEIHSIEGLNQDAHAGVLDDLLGTPPDLPPPVPPAEGRKPYSKYALIGGGIAVAAIVLALPFIIGLINGPAPAVAPPNISVATQTPEAGGQPLEGAYQTQPLETNGAAGPTAPRVATPASLASLVVLLVLVLITANTASLYLTLMITGRLPYETFVDNLINTVFMAVAISLVNFFPCLGFLGALYLLYKTYDFGLVDFLIWFGMSLAVGFGLGAILTLILRIAGVAVQ